MEESVKPCQAITIIVQHSLFYTLLSILSPYHKAERLGIKGTKINASSTKTKVSHVNVEEL